MSDLSGEEIVTPIQSYEDHMTPFYSDVRKRILGELAITGLSIHDLERRDEQDKANIELVNKLVSALPQPEVTKTYYNKSFTLKDPSMIPLIQASTLWIADSVNKKDRSRMSASPFYIIGDNKDSDLTKRTLLLADASEPYNGQVHGGYRSRQPGIVEYNPYFHSKLSNRKAKLFYEELAVHNDMASSDETKNLLDAYDRDSSSFVLSVKHLDSMAVQLFNIRNKKRYMNALSFISPDEMERYGVFDKFSDLAARFDVSNVFAEIIKDHFGDDTVSGTTP